MEELEKQSVAELKALAAKRKIDTTTIVEKDGTFWVGGVLHCFVSRYFISIPLPHTLPFRSVIDLIGKLMLSYSTNKQPTKYDLVANVCHGTIDRGEGEWRERKRE